MSSSSSSSTVERRNGSNVVYWSPEDSSRSRRRRVGKLLGLQGYSNPQGEINKNFLYNAVASFLASKHFNERRGDILPHLPAQLEGCDFYWSYEYRNGQWSTIEAARQLLESIDIHIGGVRHSEHTMNSHTANNSNRTEDTIWQIDVIKPPSRTRKRKRQLTSNYALPQNDDLHMIQQAQKDLVTPLEPFAIYGAYWSRLSLTLSALSGGLQIPYVTGASTSAELDGFPLFARTIPSNSGDARAAMVYYKQLGVSHVAVLFIKDSWGINYHSSLSQYGNEFGIQVQAFAYDPHTLERTIESLAKSQYRYIFGILRDWRHVARLGLKHGIMGTTDYVWIAAEEKGWTGDDFQVEDKDLAKALHGVGTINSYFPATHEAFETAMDEMAHSRELQQEFMDMQAAHVEFLDNFTWPKYDPTGFEKTIFDAVLALGITACNASLPDPLFTGAEFHQALVHTEFEGVTGWVQFDPQTGTRVASGVQYSMEYVVVSEERSTPDLYKFDSGLVAVVQGDSVQHFQPFVYNDNTTTAPLALPPLVEETLNLIPLWAQIFGYTLAGIVVLVAAVFGLWCYFKRNIFVLRASQPFFLCQLCFGCFLMALAVFPWALPGMSTVGAFQSLHPSFSQAEEQSTISSADNARGLDMACMSTLWLGFLGFAVCFSSLASKITRINQLLNFGSQFQHLSLGVHDVMMPLYISLTTNTALLLCITFLAPLLYARVPVNNHQDEFGRTLESFGTCRPENDKFYWFLGTLLVCNFAGVIIVTRESYKARHLPSDFSDRDSLARAMLSLLETLTLGGPLLGTVRDNPTLFFLVGSSLLSICCLTILLLLFIPKWKGRHRRHRAQSVMGQIHECVSMHSQYSVGGASGGPGSSRHGGASSASGFSGLNVFDDDMDESGYHDVTPRGMSQVIRKGSSKILHKAGSSSHYGYKGSSKSLETSSNHNKQPSNKSTSKIPISSAMSGSSNNNNSSRHHHGMSASSKTNNSIMSDSTGQQRRRVYKDASGRHRTSHSQQSHELSSRASNDAVLRRSSGNSDIDT